jgi:hypothetical protein
MSPCICAPPLAAISLLLLSRLAACWLMVQAQMSPRIVLSFP